MNAGSLRHRACFERAADVADGAGGSTRTWAPFLTVWARWQPERGGERVAAGRLESAVAGVLTVRRSTDSCAVTAADRVVLDGNTYQIRSIVNAAGRDRFLEMTIERGVAI